MCDTKICFGLAELPREPVALLGENLRHPFLAREVATALRKFKLWQNGASVRARAGVLGSGSR